MHHTELLHEVLSQEYERALRRAALKRPLRDGETAAPRRHRVRLGLATVVHRVFDLPAPRAPQGC